MRRCWTKISRSRLYLLMSCYRSSGSAHGSGIARGFFFSAWTEEEGGSLRYLAATLSKWMQMLTNRSCQHRFPSMPDAPESAQDCHQFRLRTLLANLLFFLFLFLFFTFNTLDFGCCHGLMKLAVWNPVFEHDSATFLGYPC